MLDSQRILLSTDTPRKLTTFNFDIGVVSTLRVTLSSTLDTYLLYCAVHGRFRQV